MKAAASISLKQHQHVSFHVWLDPPVSRSVGLPIKRYTLLVLVFSLSRRSTGALGPGQLAIISTQVWLNCTACHMIKGRIRVGVLKMVP